MDPSRVFSLFDHLVGTCEQRRRHFETERLGSLEIDHLAYPRSKGARSVIALTMALAWKPSSSGTSPALRWIQNVFSPADAAPLMSQEFAEMNPSSGFVTPNVRAFEDSFRHTCSPDACRLRPSLSTDLQS